MDKVVDHLLVFKGDGAIKDFPGNYTQYRQWSALQSKEEEKTEKKKNTQKTSATAERGPNSRPRRLSFKEQREMQQLEKDIEALEAEQRTLEEELCSGKLSVEELTEKSIRLPKLKEELDEKSFRWLELSEIGK
jgi:ATP-binding cassette subfamily F protein uup